MIASEAIANVRRELAMRALAGTHARAAVIVRRPIIRDLSGNNTLCAWWQFGSAIGHGQDLLTVLLPGQYVSNDDMPQVCLDLIDAGFIVLAHADERGMLPYEFPPGVLAIRDIA